MFRVRLLVGKEIDVEQEILPRDELVMYLTQLVVDDSKVRAFVKNYLRTHLFDADYEPDDGSTPVGEMWYASYSEQLVAIFRDVTDSFIFEPSNN